MEKLYNNKGQVAVAVSPGYGAGWSTWNDPEDINPMDRRFNELILNGDMDELKETCEKERLQGCGLKQTVIEWVEPNTDFVIEEYDGFETIKYRDKTNWYTT